MTVISDDEHQKSNKVKLTALLKEASKDSASESLLLFLNNKSQ